MQIGSQYPQKNTPTPTLLIKFRLYIIVVVFKKLILMVEHMEASGRKKTSCKAIAGDSLSLARDVWQGFSRQTCGTSGCLFDLGLSGAGGRRISGSGPPSR